MQADAGHLTRLLFACAAFLLTVAALIRTWASSYLHSGVVYASEIKSELLVADGPYRHVRNPLYFANVLMAIGMGAMASRIGFVLAIVSMFLFCYRLIFREEVELQANQGEQYQRYCKAVPRLMLSPWSRIASSGRKANWIAGFMAEAWYWGFPLSVIAFAITLKLRFFFIILAASSALLWTMSLLLQKKQASQTSGSSSV